MRGLAAKLGVLAFSLLVAVGAAELALKLVGYEYRPMRIATGDASDARLYHLFSDENFVYDPEMIWRPKAGFGVFNSLGFRGAELGDKPEGGVRVATVGDSNTLGWSGPEGAHWPADLERVIEAAGVPAEVINAGVWGYSSQQGVPRTREVLALEPDLVLVSFGSNDAHFVTRSDSEYSGRSEGMWRVVRFVRGLRVAQLLTAAADRFDPSSVELAPRVPLADYRSNLRQMIAEVRATGAEPVLLTRPYIGAVTAPEVWKNRAPDYNLATAEVAGEEGVLLVDLYSFFKDRDALFADESHFTAEGHQLAGSVIADHLRPLLPEDAQLRRRGRRARTGAGKAAGGKGSSSEAISE
jgi:lysophospholipase L1-like esterase